MSARKSRLPAVVITGSSILVGCSGSNNSSCSATACAPPPGTGGVFQGTVQGTPAVAIYADNGEMFIGVQNGTYYRITTTPQSTTLTGTYVAYSSSSVFPNGTDATTGTISATESASGMSGTLTDKSGSTASFSLNANADYVTGSQLSNLAATWSYTASGFSLTMTISSGGALSGTDSNECSYSGSFTLIDEVYDAYAESYVQTCNGVSAAYKGLATYVAPSGTATAQLELLADDGAGAFLDITLQ